MDLKFYQKSTEKTKSDKFYPEMVDPLQLRDTLRQIIEVGNTLDKIKKTLFYGKRVPGIECAEKAPQYPIPADLLHATIGIITEAVEFAEHLNDALFNFSEVDIVNLREEAGDLMYYQAMLFNVIDTDFAEVAALNNAKLTARYGSAFTAGAAINRDIEKERAILANS